MMVMAPRGSGSRLDGDKNKMSLKMALDKRATTWDTKRLTLKRRLVLERIITETLKRPEEFPKFGSTDWINLYLKRIGNSDLTTQHVRQWILRHYVGYFKVLNMEPPPPPVKEENSGSVLHWQLVAAIKGHEETRTGNAKAGTNSRPCGHYPFLDEPEKVSDGAAVFQRFLDRFEKNSSSDRNVPQTSVPEKTIQSEEEVFESEGVDHITDSDSEEVGGQSRTKVYNCWNESNYCKDTPSPSDSTEVMNDFDFPTPDTSNDLKNSLVRAENMDSLANPNAAVGEPSLSLD